LILVCFFFFFVEHPSPGEACNTVDCCTCRCPSLGASHHASEDCILCMWLCVWESAVWHRVTAPPAGVAVL
jgi:hypothetical protein